MLISDRWDIWQIPVAAGAPAVNLTVNGRKDAIRYQGRVQIYPDERGIDLTKPQYFSAMSRVDEERRATACSSPGKTGHEDAAVGGRVARPR